MKKNTSSKFPVILLDQGNNNILLRHGILKKCLEFGWRIVDLNITQGVIPEGCEIIGGLIGFPADHPRAEKLVNTGFPLVRIGKLKHPLDNKVPAVLTDEENIGRMAAEHFIQRNFKDVGFIGNIPWSLAQNFYESFKQYVEQHGLTCHLLRYRNLKDETKGERYQRKESELMSWLANLPKPVGILTYNDIVASRITIMCQSAKLAIPEEISILGYGDNEQLCNATLVPISSIDIGRKAQGEMAVTLLRSLIEGKRITKSPVMIPPVEVIERESSDILAVPNKLVGKVLKFIWNNLELQLSIDDIAKKFGVSRSVLDHSFNRCLSRSPSAERHRKRLERCAELLRNSDLSIAEIAHRAGFNSVSYLHRSFRKEFGTTLRNYRIGKTQ